MKYSKIYKEKMVKKMLGRNAQTASRLSEETGVSQTALSRWLREATQSTAARPTVVRTYRRPDDKISVLREAMMADEDALGALLRREGLHVADLDRFREEVLEAAAVGFEKRRKRRGLSAEQKELRVLKKELARKEKALAETAALLVLQGKLQAFFGADEEGDMDGGSGR